MSLSPLDLTTITLPQDLTADVERAGYHPAVVADVIKAAIGTEVPTAHLVQQETTFDRDLVRRHVTVLVVTATRLVIVHADDHDDPTGHDSVATATSESIPLTAIRGVMLTHVVPQPTTYVPGSLGREVTLTIGWGTVSRIDLVPAGCSDPQCEADHGFEGTITADDIALRISAEADGPVALARAMDFARALSTIVGH